MVRVLWGGERSEERLPLRPCVSFGHSCCETGLQCQGISQSCAFQLCCHVAPVLLSLSGLRAAIYVFVWLATTVACCLLQTLLYFCFTVSVSALSSPQQTHKSTQRKPHLGWIRKKQNKIQNTFRRIFGPKGKGRVCWDSEWLRAARCRFTDKKN